MSTWPRCASCGPIRRRRSAGALWRSPAGAPARHRGRLGHGGPDRVGRADAGRPDMTEYALELDDTAVRRFVAAARLAEQAERDEWADAGITAGAAVADVGCGPGAVTALLGQRVAPGGRMVGIDSDPAALAAACRLVGDSGVANVS